MRSRTCLFVVCLCLLSSTLLLAADSPYRLQFKEGASTVYTLTIHTRQEHYVINTDKKGLMGRTLDHTEDRTIVCALTLPCSQATDKVAVFDATLELRRFKIQVKDDTRVDYDRASFTPGKTQPEYVKALHAIKDFPLEVSITSGGRLAKLKGLPKLTGC